MTNQCTRHYRPLQFELCRAYKRSNDTMPGNKAPHASSVAVHNSMIANKRRDTKPEIVVRQMLREMGYKGYRLDWKKAPGHPDIAYPGKKIAIFVHGCFWHRCPRCNLPMPKTHQEYWIPKLERNVQRDEENTRRLTEDGWLVIVIWECQINDDSDKVRAILRNALQTR